ncbi:MAG: Uncharacterised protein [Glaciecola sp. HTCC2999]|jgi:cytoplasmic iron level regulating protein YaaA (DUF328/UPF0246 family)|nr:MAG: Uncharacterised protein [Glaciecola sp. HTCC2999]
MLMVVSPAKNLDYKTPVSVNTPTQPALMEKAETLLARCQQLTPAELSSLMGISDKLALLNAQRFASFDLPFTADNARPAVFAFNGDVYTGLDAGSMNDADIEFAQTHLRILSGLYGVLKPLDLMQPYRLEMGTKLDTADNKNLYEYWGNTITEHLNETLSKHDSQVVVNLASTEYFSAVKPKALNAQIVTPVFKDEKNGKVKIISFYAKKARGMMARYIIDKRIKTVEKLSEFDVAGYRFAPEQSSQNELVFIRLEKDRP